jgi:hypothetical protein
MYREKTMATATESPNGTKQPRPYEERPSLKNVTTKTRALPNRALIHAVQKWGKTSFGAQAPGSIFACTNGEDGLETLIKAGRLPETPHFPGTFRSWNHLMLALDELIIMDHEYKVFVGDTVNGMAQLCIQYVTETKFGGDPDGFDAYGRGMKPGFAPAEFQRLLGKLDSLRETKNMAIILLAHSQVKTFNNPGGLNYDRWEPVLPKEFMAMLDRWVDMILFGDFETHLEKAQKNATKTKAIGGTARILHTERSAAFDAGNRYGLPAEIDCGNSPQEAWANFMTALHPARNQPK